MAEYAICDKCKRLYEYKPIVKNEGGNEYTTVTCDKCGYTKTTSRNHVHYGNDGRKNT